MQINFFKNVWLLLYLQLGMDLINKVAESGLQLIDLEDFVPDETEIAIIDLHDYLYKGLILREKEFRDALKSIDWAVFEGQYVSIYCSTDALIPQWAFMLVVKYLFPVAREIFFGDKNSLINNIVLNKIDRININDYNEVKVIIKGCGKFQLSSEVYVAVTRHLLPAVHSIMFGEPCSTVPVYKKKNKI